MGPVAPSLLQPPPPPPPPPPAPFTLARRRSMLTIFLLFWIVVPEILFYSQSNRFDCLVIGSKPLQTKRIDRYKRNVVKDGEDEPNKDSIENKPVELETENPFMEHGLRIGIFAAIIGTAGYLYFKTGIDPEAEKKVVKFLSKSKPTMASIVGPPTANEPPMFTLLGFSITPTMILMMIAMVMLVMIIKLMLFQHHYTTQSIQEQLMWDNLLGPVPQPQSQSQLLDSQLLDSQLVGPMVVENGGVQPQQQQQQLKSGINSQVATSGGTSAPTISKLPSLNNNNNSKLNNSQLKIISRSNIGGGKSQLKSSQIQQQAKSSKQTSLKMKSLMKYGAKQLKSRQNSTDRKSSFYYY